MTYQTSRDLHHIFIVIEPTPSARQPGPELPISGGAGLGVSVEELYCLAGESKELAWLEDSGHTGWMFDVHRTFWHLIGLVLEFLQHTIGTDVGARGRVAYEDDYTKFAGIMAGCSSVAWS